MNNYPTSGHKNGQNRAVVMTVTMTNNVVNSIRNRMDARIGGVFLKPLKAQVSRPKEVRFNRVKGESRKRARLNSMGNAGENGLKQVSFSVSQPELFRVPVWEG